MTETVVAIVPMRHTSERVPGKNYRKIGGVPLYHHVIRALTEVNTISQIVIDTDSELIREDAANAFPRVKVVDRPPHLRAGSTPMNDVLLHTLSQFETDVVLQTHSTNPFVTSRTFEDAIRTFQARDSSYDALFSVTRIQARLWTADGRPMNHDPAELIRTQDLAPLFIENSCFFLFTPQCLTDTGSRLGRSPRMYEMSAMEAVDIDTEDDFALARAIMESEID